MTLVSLVLADDINTNEDDADIDEQNHDHTHHAHHAEHDGGDD